MSTMNNLQSRIPNPPSQPLPAPRQSNALQNLNLRTRQWGRVGDEGFSGFDRSYYYQNRLPIERNVVLEELRTKHQPLLTPINSQLDSRSIMPTESFVPMMSAPSSMYTTSTMAAPIMSAPYMTTTMMSAPVMTTTTMMSAPVMAAPLMTAPVRTAPTVVAATTVPVPMLNAPLNDGRRYEKLYNANTSGANLVKRRGTRKDHLVQPTLVQQQPGLTTPGTTGAVTGAKPSRKARRAYRARKGATQPVYSNVVSATQGAPIMMAPPMSAPLQQTFVKQEYVAPAQPLGMGYPIM
eukprot:TRINITY_DN225_c0_g1_i1.p1 TRINITY_DN225_c0_g1~~TRINITY_DN225_c0_g1_i1.p1  ORF type:complete len:294 (-),score=57.34 TRINITY_DN225_c0_g1_i1:84-965(-)